MAGNEDPISIKQLYFFEDQEFISRYHDFSLLYNFNLFNYVPTIILALNKFENNFIKKEKDPASYNLTEFINLYMNEDSYNHYLENYDTDTFKVNFNIVKDILRENILVQNFEKDKCAIVYTINRMNLVYLFYNISSQKINLPLNPKFIDLFETFSNYHLVKKKILTIFKNVFTTHTSNFNDKWESILTKLKQTIVTYKWPKKIDITYTKFDFIEKPNVVTVTSINNLMQQLPLKEDLVKELLIAENANLLNLKKKLNDIIVTSLENNYIIIFYYLNEDLQKKLKTLKKNDSVSSTKFLSSIKDIKTIHYYIDFKTKNFENIRKNGVNVGESFIIIINDAVERKFPNEFILNPDPDPAKAKDKDKKEETMLDFLTEKFPDIIMIDNIFSLINNTVNGDSYLINEFMLLYENLFRYDGLIGAYKYGTTVENDMKLPPVPPDLDLKMPRVANVNFTTNSSINIFSDYNVPVDGLKISDKTEIKTKVTNELFNKTFFNTDVSKIKINFNED